MSDSKLLYNVPLQVVLPPLARKDPADCNLDKLEMDKTLCKELNLTTTTTATSDSNNSHQAAAAVSPSEKKPAQNEETDGSISMSSSEKQEWSVTLYDVDRKGNVSEEDLARLVTMLYKAAGSSITVPQQPQPHEGGGTKKIKLRLSVAPDNNHTKVYIQKPSSSPTSPSGNSSLGVAMVGGGHCGNTTTPGGITPTTSAPPTNQTPAHFLNRHAGSKRDKKHHRAAARHGSEGVNGAQTAAGQEGRAQNHRRKHKKRVSRPESAPVEPTGVEGGPGQENMDRRQYYQDLVGIENDTLQTLGESPNPLNRTAPPGLLLGRGDPTTQEHNKLSRGDKADKRHTQQTVNLPPERKVSGKEKRDKRFSKTNGNTPGNKQVHFEGNHEATGQQHNRGSSARHTQRNTSTSCHRQAGKPGKSRPKSCPAPGTGQGGGLKDYFLSKEKVLENFEKEIEEGLDGLNVHLASTPAKGGGFPGNSHHQTGTIAPVMDFVNPSSLHLDFTNNLEAVSPHHLRRHRNREHEYNRSMKQVAEWIQRQHIWSAPATGNPSSSPQKQWTEHHHHGDGASPPATEPVVLKHEHHHIHEHHHHYHFYHYYET